MQIIITESFWKDFLKILKFESFLVDFIRTIKNKKHTLIDLKFAYKKFKYRVWGISLRSIFMYKKEDVIIPIIIAKKSDKNLWDNLILETRFNKILDKKGENILLDIKNWKYTAYRE